MAELKGIDLGTHLKAILSEFKSYKSIYGYPERKFYLGFQNFDLSVDFFGRKAATPLGPAAGPHTQMAQNILLAFLGGARIMELKTVQILDSLQIPRPCIDIRNIGFNIEWSQELSLDNSYMEYVTAWILLKIIQEMELLKIPKGDPFYNTIFDISVGYDLKGISSPQVSTWLKKIKNASKKIEEIFEKVPSDYSKLIGGYINPCISDSVTLSTFHGCPADEIEKIVEYLISEHNFNVIVKMNPTILGYDRVKEILQKHLGYSKIELDPEAFEKDLQFDDAVKIMKRLENFAAKHKKRIGAKFTNTLVVRNNENIFDSRDMYLSGAPLHVIAMTAMHEFRSQMGNHFRISFSAGINKHNFADAVRCNMVPVTTCTDLLKTGGYTRLFDYLKNLTDEMRKAGCSTIDQFITSDRDKNEGVNVFNAGTRYSSVLVPRLLLDNRYHYNKNKNSPPKIESHLSLFDCITCNKCLPVCPNAANFSIHTGQKAIRINDLKIVNGNFKPVSGGEFILKMKDQIANLADFCNECGDCDTYCPEYGGPFIEKPRFFFHRSTYERYKKYDGFYFPQPDTLRGRIAGIEYTLNWNEELQKYTWITPEVEIDLDIDNNFISGRKINSLNAVAEIKMKNYYIMRTLLDGLMNNHDNYYSILLRETNS